MENIGTDVESDMETQNTTATMDMPARLINAD